MVYFRNEDIVIRKLADEDPQVICREEIAQGWDATAEKYIRRLKDQSENKSVALAAEYQGNVAGYINVYWNPETGAFAGKGIPEIVDFGVLEKYRKKGIGGILMDVAEQLAAEKSDTVCIGVGLHSGYGSAQRMYAKRGYVPDGTGVWYKDKICEPYTDCRNDDDLVIYLSRSIGLIRHND